MRKESNSYNLWQRFGALLLAAVLILGMIPANSAPASADSITIGEVTKVADPETLTRPQEIYGDNTLNAGKVTVGKSVSEDAITVDGVSIPLTGDNNFLVTISQTAQVMGLSSETSVPVDVVFVLDMSNSMAGSNVTSMVTAANNAIATLMAANEENRVAVVGFSGSSGAGTSGGAHANVLSSLAHYTDDAATNHLQWVDSDGDVTPNGGYIAGRDWTTIEVTSGRWPNQTVTTKSVYAFRDGTSSGTNIHAGVALGGSILANAESTQVNGLTRIPFLVIMSDGDPTLAAGSPNSETWYNPSLTSRLGDIREADGLGFLAALTAAYYKGVITEKYFGSSADADNHAFVYTMGLGLSANGLGEMTMDPTGSTGSSYADEFEAYWDKYEAGSNFTVKVSGNSTYTITANSIDDTEKYVYGTGLGYTGSYKYNDAYFSASQGSDLEQAFTDIVAEISKKAISVPTKVTTGDHDFDGYITFTDPLGEYMEVKDMKGIIVGEHFYQGVSAGVYMENPGTNAEFDATLRNVLKTRMGLNNSDDRFATDAELDAFIDSLLATADGNSITWWGLEYPSGKDDHKVQVLGPAEDDSIAYLTDPNTDIPDNATHVCRSYFFYGTAGGTVDNPNHEYLYFVVRVERALRADPNNDQQSAPYQQTVVISAPASLLSVEKVMVNESFDDNGDPVYTVSVEEAPPARVIYEVGLWDTINEETVSTIVSEDYRTEEVNGEGQVNYDPDSDTYYFFTNDWDRSEDQGHHHRAMAKATFDAAADNPFYTYQEDTLLVDSNGNPVTSNPAGTTVYYVRTYYDWANGTENADGTISATKETKRIAVEIPADVNLTPNSDGQYYIPKGTYTAATLVTNGDDAEKLTNDTNTATIVAHPHRTGDATNSHYTVLLGNNGSISLKSNVPEPKKTVENVTQRIEDADGKAVMVGDELEYTITAENYGAEAGTITITDTVPAGTEFVSATENPTRDGSKLTWTFANVPAGQTVTATFKVRVTAAALDNAVVTSAIENTATAKLNNGPEYKTNTTSNPPAGKKVTIQGDATGSSVQVGDILEYSIEFHNDTGAVASEIKIVDTLPAGTSLVTVDHGGQYDAQTHTITWTFTDVAAGYGGVVTFTVQVDADARTPIENGATINIGNNSYTTNKTSTTLETGKLVLTKDVVIPNGLTPAEDTFTLTLTDPTGKLNGAYTTTVTGVAAGQTSTPVTFTDGVAWVQIQDGQTITIEGLAAGTTIQVTEVVPAGFKVAMSNNGQAVIPSNGEATVDVTNTYSVTNLEVLLQGDKALDGGSPDNETFGFTVVPCGADGTPTPGATGITGEVTLTSGTKAITFGKLTFTAPGTYHYLVSEVNGGQTGVNYTDTQYLVTIKVIDNGAGALVQDGSTVIQSRSGSTGAFSAYTGTMLFTNVYQPLSTSVTFEGTKTLSGRKLQAGEFSFVVTEKINGVDTVVSTGTNGYDKDGDGVISDAELSMIAFKPITYTAAGTHTYTISELAGNLPGVTYATNTFTVTVEVEDVDGQLVATVTGGDAIVFENHFEPKEVAVTLAANKELTGPDGNAVTLTGGEFSFVVKDLAGNQVASGSNDANGKITFSKIEYFLKDMKDAQGNILAEKTFQYQITELKPDSGVDPSMYYDNLVIDVSVTVTYDANTGILAIKDPNGIVYSSDVTFNNVDNSDTITVIPQGEKSTYGITGVRFSFSVVEVGGGLVTSGTSDANGNITFAGITYDYDDLGGAASKTFYYWITEDQGGSTHAGIKYDGTKYLMVVTIGLDGTNGLTQDVKYYALRQDNDPADPVDPLDPADYTASVAAVAFSNRYSVTTGTTVTMEVTKNLTGRDLQAGEFEFGLYHDGQLVATATNDANGNVTFTRVYAPSVLEEHDEEDGTRDNKATITYVIKELNNHLHGVTYATNEVTATVLLTHDNLGALVATVGYPGNTTFTNTYTPDPAEVILTGNKVLTGPNGNTVSLSGGEFSFVVLNGTTEVAWGSNDANGNINFSNIQYTYAQFLDAPKDANGNAVFTYTVKEVIPDIGADPDLQYDADTFQVTVTVSYDQASGELSAYAIYDKPVAFYNNPATIAVKPEGTKVIVNNTSLALNPLRFSFRVKYIGKDQETLAADGPVVATGINRVELNAAQTGYTVDFTEMVYDYDDAGHTFYYLLEEVNGTSNAVEYTNQQYVMAVTITRNATTDKLEATVQYKTLGGTNVIPASEVVFTNTYKSVYFSLDIQGTKTMVGKPLHGGEFDFRLQMLNDQNKLVGSIVDGVNGSTDQNGKAAITFGTLIFTEDQLNLAYESPTIVPSATLNYRYRVLISEFEPAINAIPGVTYSKQLYIAVINWPVTTDAERHKTFGQPYVEAIYVAVEDTTGTEPKYTTTGENLLDSKSVQDALTFTNTYTITTGTSVTMEVNKVLENKDLAGGEFEFGLYHDGKLVAIATNDADGKVTFTRVYAPSVLAAGQTSREIKYEIRELNNNIHGVTYDNKTIYVKVVVTDVNSALQAADPQYSYTDVDSSYAETVLSFENTYTPDPVEVTLVGNKVLTGRDLVAGEFSFVVLEGETEVAWGTNGFDATDDNDSVITGDELGKVVFSKLIYDFDDLKDAEGNRVISKTFTYTVKEVKPDVGVDPNLYYDPTEFTVTVTVTYSESTGKLTATVSDLSGVVFNNIQNPAVVTVTPEGTKTTTGNVPDGTTFSYSIYELDAQGNRVAIVGAGTSAAGKGGAAKINFSTLIYDFDDVGKSFHYEIVEDNAGNTHAGITYDDTIYLMTVSIRRNDTNKLVADVSYTLRANSGGIGGSTAAPAAETEVVFNNVYQITEPATVTIKADKVLTGRDLRPGEFGFNLYHINNGENLVAATTNGADGKITFSRTYAPSILTEYGDGVTATIDYVIREQVNNLGGVDYTQAKPVYVKVTITAGTDGTMTAVPTYYSDAGFTTEITGPTFTNSYTTTDTVFKPAVNKVLNGRNMVDDEFSFVIKTWNGTTAGNPVSYGLSKAAQSGVAGDIVFGEITYTYQQYVTAPKNANGDAEFTYEISEIPGNLVNVSYTNAKIYLKVTVHHDGFGKLIPTPTYYSDGAMTQVITGTPEFVNSYEPIGTTVTLQANKTLTGRKMVDGEFSFVVKSGATVVATGGNVGNKVQFSGIGIDAAAFKNAAKDTNDNAVFVFTMEELDTNQGAMTFDTNKYYAEVVVKNNLATGKLEIVSVTYFDDETPQTQLSGAPTFVNVYEPVAVEMALPVHKDLINHTLEAGKFTFEVKYEGQVVAQITNDANGNAVFTGHYPVSVLDGVTPDTNNVRSKTFTYTITEVAGTADSTDDNGTYTYDSSVYTVTVTVTDDGKGNLTASVSIKKDNRDAQNVVFTNRFAPDSINVDLSAAIEATKSVVDDEGNVLTYKLEGHTFRVTDLNGAPVKDAYGNDIVGVSDANGKIHFADFTFSMEGEYRYLLQEIIPDGAVLNPDGTYTLDGMTYDTSVWCMHIRVRYNPDDGKLSVSNEDVYTHILTVQGHADDGIQAQAEEAPIFVNVYNADDVQMHLTLDKTITGDRTAVKEHEFLFHLLNADGTIAGEARNHHDGTVNFYLDYDLQDLKGQSSRTFVYTVKEVIPEGAVKNADGTYTLDGVTYDNGTHTVTVTLEDNGKGELVTKLNGAVAAGKVDTGIDFVNKYEAADVSVTFHAIKRMEGMPLEDGIYTFYLKDGDDVLAKGTNKADGTVVFDKGKTYTEPGTYTYTMVEYKETKPGVTFDETSFKVTVEVTDNGKGNLVAKITYTTDEGTYDQPVFVNIYQPTGVGVVIEAQKELTGRDLVDSEFTFQLKDSQGAVVSQVKNDADGKIAFDSQRFDTVGTHTFTIVEAIPANAVQNADGTYTLNGVTYDQTVYTVVVEITDPGFDGQLDKKVTYYLGTEVVDAAKVRFTNIYEADAAATNVTAKKELAGKKLEEGQFSFVLVNQANKAETYTATNKADGSITFQNLTFSVAGTYVYDLYEVKGDDEQHYTYDKTVYTVTITVVDNGDGTMTATPVYSKTPVFQNTYKPDAITVVLEGKKELTGRDLVDGEFDFEVRDDKGNLVTTGTNKADGTIVFRQMVIDSERDLVLNVTEVKGDDKQIEYDDYVYRVKLTVTNDNGVLKADVQYLDGDIVFYNEYEIPETPPTGDDTPLFLYMGLMLTSAVALMAVLVLGKKKERKHI